MKAQIASASLIIDAPAEEIYQLIADYHHGHRQILPKENFLSLEVEEGGFGEGTKIRFKMRILGKVQDFHAAISELLPGRVLLETDLDSGAVTSFALTPNETNDQTIVTISTELRGQGLIEGFLAKRILQGIYRHELVLLKHAAEGTVQA